MLGARRTGAALALGLIGALVQAQPALAAGANDSPAAGAPLWQAIGATAAAVVLITALVVIGLGHRSGRIEALGRLARFAGRVGNLPAWAALPAAIAALGAAVCGFGMYWDISLHIDNGRDPGPFANPSHYLILGGLFTLFAAGWLCIVLPEGRPSPAAVRITRTWQAPLSGLLLIASASFGLAGFPADDTWHRMFGQDVTLWGPTHLMLLGGGAMSVLSILVILAEARLARRSPERARPAAAAAPPRRRRALYGLRLIAGFGGLLAALSIFQAEFDYGIPQFRLLFHPVTLALFAAIALVPARVIGGPGAALGSVAFFLLARTAMMLPSAGLEHTIPHFPLYLAAAVAVELAALAPIARRRPYGLGVLAGALIGSVGTIAEWGWSQVWMPIPWPAHMIPEALALSIPVGIAGGVVGAFLAAALRLRADLATGRRALASVAVSLLVVAGVFAYLLPTSVPEGARAEVVLSETTAPPQRMAQAKVRFTPRSVAEDADWLTLTAGQGRDGGTMVVDHLRRIRAGVYETTEPFPVHGQWKAVLRLHRGEILAGVPVHAPADAAIPLPAIPARERFERPFLADRENFQRERQLHVPDWMWPASISIVGALGLAFLLLIGWVLVRLARSAEPGRTPPRPIIASFEPRTRARAAVGSGRR
jgi:hypothetical protein